MKSQVAMSAFEGDAEGLIRRKYQIPGTAIEFALNRCACLCERAWVS